MDTCAKCGGSGDIQRSPRYQVRKELVGGMNVVLQDVVDLLLCGVCGETLRADIPDMPGLIAAVCVVRSAKEPLKLSGSEIRFLRKAIGKNAKELAQELRVTDETVSRWENGHLVMGEPAERIFRWMVCDAIGDCAPGISWENEDILKKMNIVSVSAQPLVMYFERTGEKRKQGRRSKKPQYELKAA